MPLVESLFTSLKEGWMDLEDFGSLCQNVLDVGLGLLLPHGHVSVQFRQNGRIRQPIAPHASLPLPHRKDLNIDSDKAKPRVLSLGFEVSGTIKMQK